MSFFSCSSKQDPLSNSIANISCDSRLKLRARDEGLVIQNISWEDTARYKNSCVGPNISDMTLRLSDDKSSVSTLLPMIRYSNFNDKTADLPMDSFNLTVGNEKLGGTPKRISLKEYLQNIGEYVKMDSGASCPSMYCEEKDQNVLTSAQFCILPLADGTVEFNVSLYNYQSVSDDPAVLVLVCSQKGTSAQAIFGGTTQLYFNNSGDAANYVAERLKDERKRLGKNTEAKMDTDEQERNCLFIVQIPLEQKPKPVRQLQSCDEEDEEEECYLEECETELCFIEECSAGLDDLRSIATNAAKGMDKAMLSIGKTHSKFEGIKDYTLKRDKRFPIRLTFQFYLVTDRKDVPESMWKEMKQTIDGVYSKSVATGSLVTEINTKRTTEWTSKAEHKSKEFTNTLPDGVITSNQMFKF